MFLCIVVVKLFVSGILVRSSSLVSIIESHSSLRWGVIWVELPGVVEFQFDKSRRMLFFGADCSRVLYSNLVPRLLTELEVYLLHLAS